MNFLKKIFVRQDQPVKSYNDFWAWFQYNQRDFFNVINKRKDIEKDFFDKISPKLGELNDGYFYLTGMYDDNTVELILTADGNAKNIVFIEELVNAAPKIEGWKITALKPPSKIEDVSIDMAGYQFNSENIYFYANENNKYPDEIDITIVHDDFTEENKSQISNGTYIFLDNFLGELDFVNNIDKLNTIGIQQAKNELVPIAKLKDFLTWRQKEFVEKYDGIRYNTENDSHAILEAEFESGYKLLAVINTELLKWDSKASHPWISVLTFKYDGEDNNGMPDEEDYIMMQKIEEELTLELKDADGYLYIGRQTAKGEREIYFACKDFRKPSKVFLKIQQTYSNRFVIEYDIYKDKYWKSFEKFNTV